MTKATHLDRRHLQNHGTINHHLQQQHTVAVVMVPFPLQGHLNQFLQLSRLVSSYDNIHVHYIGTTIHNRQAKLRVHGDPQIYNNIKFHDFELPYIKTLLPPNPNSVIKFPAHLQPVFDATSKHLRQPFFQFLKALAPKYRRVIVVHDSLMSYVVQDMKLISNSESYSFHTTSAISTFYYVWESTGRPHLDDFPKDNNNVVTPSCANEGCLTPEFAKFVAAQHKLSNMNSGKLYNTCRAIEGKYIDLLAKLPLNANKKLFPVGPLNPVSINNTTTKYCNNLHECLKWLDKQETNSVIYVSFGTTTSFTEEQIKELALGLERSRQKFLWVLRDADKGDIFANNDDVRRVQLQLPEGYEERVKDRGMIIRDWAPQLEILGHKSTGGFMSHCGWNSCMESISMGVPIATWPMHSDQPKNAVLVTEELRIGLVVRDWGRRLDVVRWGTIENVVRRLMASEEGREMRERVAGLGDTVQGLVGKDGESRVEMDNFIAHITRSS